MSHTPRGTLADRRRAYAVQLRSMRRTYQQIADAVLPCPEHEGVGGISPAVCAAEHATKRAAGGGPLVDCMPMYANREGARRAVEQGMALLYPVDEKSRDRLKQDMLATVDTALARIMRDVIGSQDPADRARAGNVVVRLADRFAKLAGLDAPTQVKITEELDDEIAAALAALAETPTPTPAQLTED